MKTQKPVDPWLEHLAWLMDRSIRIGPWRIGLDGLIGLFPGLGDFAGTAVSTLIITNAIQDGLPRAAIFRMITNVAFDSLLGVIPVVGDLFDFAYKANSKNIEIYREALLHERRPVRDWAFLILVVAILIVLAGLPLLGLIFLGRLLAPHLPFANLT